MDFWGEDLTMNKNKIDMTFTLYKWGIGTIACSLFMLESLPVYAHSFIDDSVLTGNIFFWNRDRERRTYTEDHSRGDYRSNIRQSTLNANLDFRSGYIANVLAIELGGYGAWEVSNGGNGHPNEIGFSGSKNPYQEKWDKDISGLSFYKAQLNLKMDDHFWLKGGFIQPSGQTLLAPHWSLLPGTYRGVEVGTYIDYDDKGALSLSYMWTDRYKAPWYKDLYKFRQWDKQQTIRYLHSVGFKYDFKNNLILEGAFGQAHNYMDQYLAKVAYQTQLFTYPLSLSYQFYGAKDQQHSGKSVYDGLAWLQAATLHYQIGAVGIRTEGVMVKAEGNQGFFLQRMTPGYASSNGRLDIWWNSRSDFNADGERALFGEISYDLGYLSPTLQGWQVATSYAYGWHAKPNQQFKLIGQNHQLKESAWNFDLTYTVPDGWAKDSRAQLHYTRYDNHANRDWHDGYDNIFLDEHDIKFIVTIPFTVFNLNRK